MVEVPPDSVATFANDGSYQVHEQAGPHVWFLIFNVKEGPLADKKVRQAVNYAIDKKALVENVLQGTAEVAAGPTPPAFSWAYNDSLNPYPYDPDKAAALIKEAGHEGERQGNGRQPVRESRSAVVRNLRERAQAYTMRLRGRARERAKGREWVSEE